MQTASSHNARQGATTASFNPAKSQPATDGKIRLGDGRYNKVAFSGQGPKTEWQTDKVFTDTATGLAVEVQKLPLRTPKFSIIVGQVRDGGGVGRFIRPSVKIETAKVDVAKNGMTLARLYDEAALYVEAELQAIEDKFIEDKQYREQRQIDRETGKDNVVQTGKTAREAAKRARHENNQVARRAADAELRLKMKGKGK